MVRTGLQVLLDDRLDLLAGRRVGLVSHPAAVLPDLTGIVDALLDRGIQLTALFGAEHGFAGSAADGMPVDHGVDRHTGLPVYSLYGEVLELTPEMLRQVDVLVVDFQDVGVRFYTYLSTLYHLLRSAGQTELPVILLDRPNPLTGAIVEGPLVEPGFESFVGLVPVPIRHGMTLGELARYINSEYELEAQLTVLPMDGWEREMWFDDTGLPWVITSPAMPHFTTTLLYPGMCFIEGTNLSEGRGSALPFEVTGAPWLDGYALAGRLNRLLLPGVRFRPHSFVPTASKFAGQLCEGVQMYLFDRQIYRPILTGLHVLAAIRDLAPQEFAFLEPAAEGRPCHFDLLAGSAQIREHILSGGLVDDLLSDWASATETFLNVRDQVFVVSLSDCDHPLIVVSTELRRF